MIAELATNYQDDRGVIEIAKLSAQAPKPERGERRAPPAGPPPERSGAGSN